MGSTTSIRVINHRFYRQIPTTVYGKDHPEYYAEVSGKRVTTDHPDIMVGTLSYLYSRKPPRTIKPRPNVQIQLCSIECCQIHAINAPNCPKNVQFCNDLKGWRRLTEHISIWNYNVNFKNYLLPCPNLRVIEPNIRFFAANHVTGVFMQAAGNAVSATFFSGFLTVISSVIFLIIFIIIAPLLDIHPV